MNSCLSNLPKCFVCSFFHVDFKGDTLIFTCLFILFSLYDLANVVPTLAKFYHQASEAYEQACTRHISMIIVNVSVFLFFPFAKHYNICCTLNSLSFLLISPGQQFDRLFQFMKRIEDLMFTVAPEEVSDYCCV